MGPMFTAWQHSRLRLVFEHVLVVKHMNELILS